MRIGIMAVLGILLVSPTRGCKSQPTDQGTVSSSQASPQTSSQSPKLVVLTHGDSSFITVQDVGGKSYRRLTDRTSGLERYPVFSKNGMLIAYSYADSDLGRSEVWISRIDGTQSRRVTSLDEDALMPAFAENDRSLLYVRSGFTGHYSPIVGSRKHKFDIAKIAIGADGPISGSMPVMLMTQEFYDLKSLSVSEDGTAFLISTSGYPIGDLLEEFDLDAPQRMKRIYQPHVDGAPDAGAIYGQAGYLGADIVFDAASQPKDGGNFDYNVYKMDGTTGGGIVQISHHRGMIDDLLVQDGKVFSLQDGRWVGIEAAPTQP